MCACLTSDLFRMTYLDTPWLWTLICGTPPSSALFSFLPYLCTKTIEHILLTCSDFIEMRESHFTAKSLRMLFQDILPEKILNF